MLFSDGVIENEADEKYYLQFEIKKFDEEVDLMPELERANGQQMVKDRFRDWIKVTNEEVGNIKVARMRDEMGPYYVSDTRFYTPSWLKNSHVPDVQPNEIERPEAQFETPSDISSDSEISETGTSSASKTGAHVEVSNELSVSTAHPNGCGPGQYEPSVQGYSNAQVSVLNEKAGEADQRTQSAHISDVANSLLSGTKTLQQPSCSNMSIPHSMEEHGNVCRNRIHMDSTSFSFRPPISMALLELEPDQEFDGDDANSFLINQLDNISISYASIDEAAGHVLSAMERELWHSTAINTLPQKHFDESEDITGIAKTQTFSGLGANVSNTATGSSNGNQNQINTFSISSNSAIMSSTPRARNTGDGFSGFLNITVTNASASDSAKVLSNAAENTPNANIMSDIASVVHKNTAGELPIHNAARHNCINGDHTDAELGLSIGHVTNPPSLDDISSAGSSDIAPKVSILDYQHLKVFVDDVLLYALDVEQRTKRREQLKVLYMNAVRKTVLEKLNLEKKGQRGVLRLVQIASRYSINTQNISSDAHDAREEYRRQALFFNKEKLTQPKPNEYVHNAIKNIFRSELNVPVSVPEEPPLPVFETARDLRETHDFKQLYEEHAEKAPHD